MNHDLAAAEPYELTVNGHGRVVEGAWIGESLLHVLRERLQLAGAKNACEQGECGSCSVLVDDVLVCACLVAAATLPGADIRTVEALDDGRAIDSDPDPQSLSVVQRAFVDAGAVQCGFCTPGLVVAVHDLIERRDLSGAPAALTELDVREALSGNLCRCTGYGRVLEAVQRAIEAAR